MTESLVSGGSTSGAGLPFPLTDYHVHLSDRLTLEGAVALAADRGQRFGILEHPGAAFSPFGLDTDAELRAFLGQVRQHPLYVGLQPMYRGWSAAFSDDALSELDYVLMDAGIKFTFGTNGRDRNAGNVHYCIEMAHKAGLTAEDMFAPETR